MKDVCTVHHKLMADVAVLLRTIARMENFHFPAIPKFLTRFSCGVCIHISTTRCRYKEYSEEVGNLVREVVGEELGLERGREVVAGLENVREETAWIYEELVNIAAVARDENLVQEMFKARRSPGEGREEKEEGRKERQGKQQGQEEKNKFALSVLRRSAVHVLITLMLSLFAFVRFSTFKSIPNIIKLFKGESEARRAGARCAETINRWRAS